MVADARIRVILENLASKGLAEIDQSLGKFKQGLMDVANFSAKAGAAIGTVAITMRKAFDLGEEGAAVTQTAESFDFLLQKVGAAPGLLEDLQAASKGTISDLQLMQSTSLLLAGAQGELATELANATPELLEIAKAANKLNPSLGDTTFLYDSLSRGIKRASPLILDNLGLTISVGEANEKYAESLGVAADALTEEQQKLALLNAVLDQGGNLISQVGGNTDSATDSFQRMNAALENASNTIKTKFAPYLADAADAVTLLLTGSEQLANAYADHNEKVFRTAQSYEDYYDELKRVHGLQGRFVELTEDGVEIFKKQGTRVIEVTDQYDVYSRAVWEATRRSLDEIDAVETVNSELKYLDATMKEVITRRDEDNEKIKEHVQNIREEIKATRNLALANEALSAGLAGTLTDAYERYKETIADIAEDNADLNKEMAEFSSGTDAHAAKVNELSDKISALKDENLGYIETLKELKARGETDSEYYKEQADLANKTAFEVFELEEQYRSLGNAAQETAVGGVGDLTDQFEENRKKAQEAKDALNEATKELIYQKASAGLSTDAAIALARSLGILNEEDYTVIASLEKLRQEYDKNKDGAIEAGEGAAQYAEEIRILTDTVLKLRDEDIPLTFDNIRNAMEQAKVSGDLLNDTAVVQRNEFAALDMQARNLVDTLHDLSAMGVDVSGTVSLSGAVAGGFGSNTGGMATSVVVNYSPTLSLADQYELEQILTPVLRRIIVNEGFSP